MIDNLSMAIVELMWYASMICVMGDSLCVALEVVNVALWMPLLQSVHWLYVYSHRIWMSVLVH